MTTALVLSDVRFERKQQDDRWGIQDHPDGTGPLFQLHATRMRMDTQVSFAQGKGTWRHVLLEEVYEALAETDLKKLRAELVQVAAVAVSWVEAIDQRAAG